MIGHPCGLNGYGKPCFFIESTRVDSLLVVLEFSTVPILLPVEVYHTDPLDDNPAKSAECRPTIPVTFSFGLDLGVLDKEAQPIFYHLCNQLKCPAKCLIGPT